MIPNEIVTTYAEEAGIEVEQSRVVYNNLENFFYEVVSTNQTLFPSKEIDPAWHHFILHTKAYYEFCDSKFGRIVHHTPMKTPPDFADCGATCDAG
jgi:hypothetical protein